MLSLIKTFLKRKKKFELLFKNDNFKLHFFTQTHIMREMCERTALKVKYGSQLFVKHENPMLIVMSYRIDTTRQNKAQLNFRLEYVFI